MQKKKYPHFLLTLGSWQNLSITISISTKRAQQQPVGKKRPQQNEEFPLHIRKDGGILPIQSYLTWH